MVEDLKEKEALKEKVEKLKQEVEKAKKDIQDTYEKFENHKLTDHFHRNNLTYIEIETYKIRKPFIIFLKDKIPIKQLKNLKLIRKRKYFALDNGNYNRNYYNKEVVDKFKNALSILDKYSNEYEKQCLTEELCKYTDCLEKLTPTKTCLQCNSEYPKEAKFCPNCGCNINYDSKVLCYTCENYNALGECKTIHYLYQKTAVIECQYYKKKENGTKLNLTSVIKPITTTSTGTSYVYWNPEGTPQWYDHPVEVKPMEYKYKPMNPFVDSPNKSCINCEFHYKTKNEEPCICCYEYKLYKTIKVDPPKKSPKGLTIDKKWICSYYHECLSYTPKEYRCNYNCRERYSCRLYRNFIKKYQYNGTIPKIEKPQDKKDICEYFMNLCDKTSEVCGTKDYKECDHYCSFKKKESEKEETEPWMHIIVECKNCKHLHSLGNGTSYCNKGFSVKLIEKGNCKYYEAKEKEANRCPYFDKCTDIKLKNIITSICNNIQYIHNNTECEEYTKFEKESKRNKCGYMGYCSHYKKTNPLCFSLNRKTNCIYYQSKGG